MKSAIFLDRDGVINETIEDEGTLRGPRLARDFRLRGEDWSVLDDAKRAGFQLIVVTNQPDIARGKMSPHTLEEMHMRLRRTLPVDDILVCPHDDADSCPCRKPKPGLLLEAARCHDIVLADSYVIGDTRRDMETAHNAGCREAFLLSAPYNREILDVARVTSVSEAIQRIIEECSHHGNLS